MKVSKIAAMLFIAFTGISRGALPVHINNLQSNTASIHLPFVKVGDANGGPGGNGESGDNSPGARGGDGGNNSDSGNGNDSGNANGTGTRSSG